MPYIGRVNPSLGVKRDFKWEQREHAIHASGDFFHPPASPGPNLWAHVVHHAQPGALGQSGKRQIETRRIDQDDHPRTALTRLP